jgi:hypothetical protein
VAPGLVLADERVARRSHSIVESVEVCYDARGDLLAYCRTTNGGIQVDLPELASFYYERDADNVLAVPHAQLAPEFLMDTYHHCVLPLILPALGTNVLHASAVACEEGVVAFCGQSEAGKSTIAVGLARRGHRLWADDAVGVDAGQAQPMAIALPFAVRLRPDSARFFGADEPTANSCERGESAPLAFLCVLQRTPDARRPVTIERVDAASACRAALSHAYCFSVKDTARKRRMVEGYLALTARVPVYEIRFRPGFEHLPMVLDAIEELM